MERTAAKRVYTVREAAEAYGLPEYAVRNWCKRGEIRHLKAGNRIYISPEAIESFITGGAR